MLTKLTSGADSNGSSCDDDSERLRTETRALVEAGFTEYYDPRDGSGIGGQGFSWSAALTLAWLTEG